MAKSQYRPLDLKEGKSQELITEFGRDRIKFFQTDVSDYQSVQDSFKGVLDWKKRFTGLIAAAGYATNKNSIETTPEEWRAMISCHLDGTFSAINLREDFGLIINFQVP